MIHSLGKRKKKKKKKKPGSVLFLFDLLKRILSKLLVQATKIARNYSLLKFKWATNRKKRNYFLKPKGIVFPRPELRTIAVVCFCIHIVALSRSYINNVQGLLSEAWS